MVYKENDPKAPPTLSNPKKIHSLVIIATHKVIIKGIEYDFDIIDKNRNVAAFTVAVNEGTLCPPQPADKCKGAIIANSVY